MIFRELGAYVVKVWWRLGVLHPLRRLCLLFVRRGAQAEARALVVLLDNLGDVAMNLGTLRSLPAALPGREVHLLVDASTAEVAKQSGLQVVAISRQDLRKTLVRSVRLLASLKRTGYGTVVHLSTVQLGLVEYASAITCIGAFTRIGYEGEEIFTRPAPGHLYDRLALRFALPRLERKLTRLVPRAQGAVHALRHSEAFLRGFAPPGAPLSVVPEMRVAPATRAGRYAILGVGAAVSYRRWPLRRFAEVALALQGQGLEVVLVGSAAERELCAALAGIVPGTANVAGETDLPTLLALIAGADVVVCNETAYAHLAVALRRPLACITGGGHIGRCSLHGYPSTVWVHEPAPCDGDNWACGRHLVSGQAAPCIEAISTSQVLAGVAEALRAPEGPFLLP